MNEVIKSVRYGILIGLLCLIFGIGWVFYLVLGHESIHRNLESLTAAEKDNDINHFHPVKFEYIHGNQEEDTDTEKEVHTHHTDEEHQHSTEGELQHAEGEMTEHHHEGEHNSPIMELAHERLLRGHIHAMGLGLAVIAISIVIAFSSANEGVKTVVSILTGLGGFIYPFAWIIMGYRTPSLGPDGAESSVMLIAGPSVILILFGIFTAVVYFIKDIFSRSRI